MSAGVKCTSGQQMRSYFGVCPGRHFSKGLEGVSTVSMGGSGMGWAWTVQSAVGWTEQTQSKGDLVTLLRSWVRFFLPCPLTSQLWTFWSTPPWLWGSMIWTEWYYQHPWVPRFKTLIWNFWTSYYWHKAIPLNNPHWHLPTNWSARLYLLLWRTLINTLPFIRFYW